MPSGSIDGRESVILDTNILVYGFTSDDIPKQTTAARLMRDLLYTGRLTLTTQIHNEFHAAITRNSPVA
jgi:predicted nucleic acid-binding protein